MILADLVGERGYTRINADIKISPSKYVEFQRKSSTFLPENIHTSIGQNV